MPGWDTGTLEVGDIRFDVDSSNSDLFQAHATRLRVVTSEKVEVLPKKEAEVSGSTISWDMDTLRLPVYNRYQSSVIFEIGKGGGALAPLGIGVHPDAIAVLWMQDLTDDIEQEVKLPVLVGKKMETLRQNAINDQTAKFHDFQVVGTLTARLKLDSGLDDDHEVSTIATFLYADPLMRDPEFAIESGKTTRFRSIVSGIYLIRLVACIVELTSFPSDHVEGEAEVAKKQAHFRDDGVIDKHEQKELDRVHKRQLESRGRGAAQVKAYRSAKWMMRVS